MSTHLKIGKIYAINSIGPSWGAHRCDVELRKGNYEIEKGDYVVVLSEKPGEYENHLIVTILTSNGDCCWTYVNIGELCKWQLIST